MAKDNAQRQAAYRLRHLKEEKSTGVRLNQVIDFHAKLALERLASCYGVTQRAILERLIGQGQRAVLEKLGGQAQDDYYDRRLRLSEEDATQ